MNKILCISKDNLNAEGIADKKYDAILISNYIFYPLKVKWINLSSLEKVIEYAFDALLEENGTILIKRTASEFKNVKDLELLIRKYLANDILEFICQCIDYNSKVLGFNSPPISTYLIGLKKGTKDNIIGKVRFISMPDKTLLKENFSGEHSLYEFSESAGLVPFTREECLSQPNFVEILISEVTYLEPHYYFPLNEVDECINGIQLRDIMNIPQSQSHGKWTYRLDYFKITYPDPFGATIFQDILVLS
ncbi:MAG: hypothetical protein WCI31_12995 [Prolixibacteraceae bacterium]